MLVQTLPQLLGWIPREKAPARTDTAWPSLRICTAFLSPNMRLRECALHHNCYRDCTSTIMHKDLGFASEIPEHHYLTHRPLQCAQTRYTVCHALAGMPGPMEEGRHITLINQLEWREQDWKKAAQTRVKCIWLDVGDKIGPAGP